MERAGDAQMQELLRKAQLMSDNEVVWFLGLTAVLIVLTCCGV